jgi:hypothetical protein
MTESNISSPEGDKITIEQYKQLCHEVRNYLNLNNQYDNPSGSFKHIINNFKASVVLFESEEVWEMFDDEGKKGNYEDMLKNFTAIKKYFELLEKFPKFKEAETKEGPGYFPGEFKNITIIADLIALYEQKLNQNI